MDERTRRIKIIDGLNEKAEELNLNGVLTVIGAKAKYFDEAKREIVEQAKKQSKQSYFFCLHSDIDKFVRVRGDLYIACNFWASFVTDQDAKKLIRTVKIRLFKVTRDFEWPESEKGRLRCKIRIF